MFWFKNLSLFSIIVRKWNVIIYLLLEINTNWAFTYWFWKLGTLYLPIDCHRSNFSRRPTLHRPFSPTQSPTQCHSWCHYRYRRPTGSAWRTVRDVSFSVFCIIRSAYCGHFVKINNFNCFLFLFGVWSHDQLVFDSMTPVIVSISWRCSSICSDFHGIRW